MNDAMKAHMQSSDTWQRALYMLLFAVIWTATEVVLFLVALFQLGSALLGQHIVWLQVGVNCSSPLGLQVGNSATEHACVAVSIAKVRLWVRIKARCLML